MDCEQLSYDSCCAPFHRGRATGSVLPQTAEQLMRSRYSAFALGLVDYLLSSWHESTRPRELELDAQTQWLGLHIRKVRAGGPTASRGVVHFVAHYRNGNQPGTQEETSTFVREAGTWFYLDAL